MTKNSRFLHLRARIRRARFPLLVILLLGFGIGRHVISQIAAPDDALPAPWAARELDDIKATGYARVTGSTYELRQAGPNNTATKDTHQLLQRPWTNDAILTARLLSINAADPAAHAGIVLRAGLNPGDPTLLLTITASNHIQFVRRTEPDAVPESDTYNALPGSGVQVQRSVPGTPRVWVNATNTTRLTLPAWLRLVRRGPDVAAFVSTDNTNWHWIGTERIQLPPQIQAGLAVRSADEQRPCVARFDQLTLQPLSLTNGPSPSPLAPAGAGKGLLGTYTDSSGSNVVQRLNATINFGWARRNPAPGIASQNFSGTWEGSIEAQHTGPCAFHLFHDDDARLWIGDALLIDDRGKQSVREARAIVPLVAGVKYPVRLEYTQGRGPAVLKLLWSGPATPRAVIPQSQLHPPARLALPELARPSVVDLAAGLDALKATDQLPGLSAPWLSRAFGAQTNAGDARNADEQFELTARGSITGRGADEGRFIYQPWTGDVEIIARIGEVLPHGHQSDGHDPDGHQPGQPPAQPSAKAGVMLRETLADDSPHAFVAVSHHGPTRFFHRLIDANAAQPFRPPTPAAPWVKLVRRGDSFAGYSSPDGRSWTWLGSVTLPMPEEIFVGLAAGSGNLRTASAAQKSDPDSDPDPPPDPKPDPGPLPDPAPDPRTDTNAVPPLYAVTFDNVLIKNPDPLNPIIGDGDGLSATYFGAGTNFFKTIDPTINFFWGTRAPIDGIGNFSVRWEGLVEAQFSEPYRLHVINDSAIRLWFDGKPLLQGGNGPANRERSVRVRTEVTSSFSARVYGTSFPTLAPQADRLTSQARNGSLLAAHESPSYSADSQRPGCGI